MLSMIDDIKNRYPHPIAGQQAQYPYAPDEYCVGGSYCKYLGYTIQDLAFPMSKELARVILDHNPALDAEAARDYAHAIIDYNDAERFDEAWQLLAQVLPYTPEKD